MNEIIRSIESAQLRTDIPAFNVGDTVRVFVKVVEGARERLQAFEGVVSPAATAPSARRSPSAARPTASASSARSRCTRRSSTTSRSSVVAMCAAPSFTTCAVCAARLPRSRSAATDSRTRLTAVPAILTGGRDFASSGHKIGRGR